jgi:hypothetical protein
MEFQTLPGFTKSQKWISEKKEKRVGATDASQADLDPPACLGLARPNRYAAVRSRSDGAHPFFFARRRLHAMASGRARVWGVCALTEGAVTADDG